MTITLGTQKQFDADDVFAPAFVGLTSTTGIVAYFFDDGVDDGIKAIHFTLSSGVITIGAEATVLSGEGNSPRLARLTDTSAMLFIRAGATGNNWKAVVLTVSGTTITVNSVLTLTDTGSAGSGSEDLTALTSTKALAIYSRNTASKAVILSVSGTTITEGTPFQFDPSPTDSKVAKLTDTKAVVTYEDASNSNRLSGQVLDISGTTITGNTVYELSTIAWTGSEDDISVATLSSTKYICVFRNPSDSKIDGLIVDEAATVLTPGSVQDVETSDTTRAVEIAAFSATKAMMFHRIVSNNDLRLYELSVSGTTITVDDTEDVSIGGGETEVGGDTLDSATAIAVWNATGEAISAGAGDLSLAAMTKPADVDAAGSFIYVALLQGGTPILTKISTALNADGTTVFDPGSGDQIGVECGRFNSDVIWVVGQFDGTNVIEISEDGGDSFSVADDGTIGGIRSFDMGPDSDDRLLVFDEDNGDILETVDSGTNWTTIASGITPEVYAIGRLGKNVEESAFGNQGAASDNVDYSVNSGDDLEDLSFPINQDVTGIIVN